MAAQHQWLMGVLGRGSEADIADESVERETAVTEVSDGYVVR